MSFMIENKELNVGIDETQILKIIGYELGPTAPARLLSLVNELARVSLGLIKPSYSYIIRDIKSVEGETIIVNSDEGIIRVQTTDTTLIEKNMPVGVGDLEIGEAVVVSGPQNDDGGITARSVMSVGAFRFGQPSRGE